MHNVLEITYAMTPGGAPKNLMTICRYLDRSRFRVFGCAFSNKGPWDSLLQDRVEDFLMAAGDVDRVIDFLRANSIDILHFHGIDYGRTLARESTLRLLAYCRKNNIMVVESAPFPYYDPAIDEMLDIKLVKSHVCLLKHSTRFPEVAANPQKYGVLYNMLDTEDLKALRLSPSALEHKKQEFNLTESSLILGKVGRASLWKWDDLLVETVKQLRRRIPSVKAIVRSMPDFKRKRIERDGLTDHFIVLPESARMQEVCQVYQLIDVMVHTSRIGETFGMAIAESLFFGTPVLTRSTDFANRLILFDRDNAQVELVRDGVNGYIAQSPRKAAARLDKLARDRALYESMAEKARQDAQRFSARRLIPKLENIFETGVVEPDGLFMTMDNYRRNIPREGIIASLHEDIKAMYEKFIIEDRGRA